MTDKENARKSPPKGGRKGGAVFPRYSLKTAIPWAQSLVSKTHLGPIKKDIVEHSIVKSKSGVANMKISSLKQFGLLDGTVESYTATTLAKELVNSPEEESIISKQEACLKPNVFSSIFETFHGDRVSRAKLRQRATTLNVHPESADECVSMYIESLEYAGLLSIEGDDVVHLPATSRVSSSKALNENQQAAEDFESGEGHALDQEQEHDHSCDHTEDNDSSTKAGLVKAVFQVNINLDASLDSEKLEKQLRLLRKYGAI